MEPTEAEIYANYKRGKTYVSPTIVAQQSPVSDPTHAQAGRRFRIAHKAIDTQESHSFVSEAGELVIRVTAGNRQIIVAKFYEDDRAIFNLQIQRYETREGKPKPTKVAFSFHGDEVLRLLKFLLNMKRLQLKNSELLNIGDEALELLLLSPQDARNLLAVNPKLISEALKSQVTPSDMVAIAYRRDQVQAFRRLLDDPGTTEPIWQEFFEKNRWIFGYGLTFIFLSSLDGKDLELTVSGNDIWQRGKRTDALLKSRGAIEAMCFVEIKKHSTRLLKERPYRPACWGPSDELSGAVVQCQVTVEQATRKLAEKLEPLDPNGDPTGEEIFQFQPRAFLIVGSLDEFVTNNRVATERYRSFELFRRNTVRPEILTFDELYERAKFIVEVAES